MYLLATFEECHENLPHILTESISASSLFVTSLWCVSTRVQLAREKAGTACLFRFIFDRTGKVISAGARITSKCTNGCHRKRACVSVFVCDLWWPVCPLVGLCGLKCLLLGGQRRHSRRKAPIRPQRPISNSSTTDVELLSALSPTHI